MRGIMDTHNYLLWRKIADDHVFFRHPHPKIYKKIKKTINLANEGLNPAEFEERGGLSRYNFENFFYIIYERHKTLQKFLRVNKPYQLRKTKGNFKKEKNEPLKDNWNVLVLLVDFNDQEKITPVDYYHDLLFSENKVETGSLREYYAEVSWNQLNIEGDVDGWYRARKKYSDYVDLGKVNTDTLRWKMPKAKELVKETILQAKKRNNINFSKYDNTGNGNIDTLIVVYAGEGAERTSNFSYIYPHRGKFLKPIEINDGLVADNYILMHELPSYDIGGYCHEVAHCLGVPDLYLPDFSSTIVGRWCLMGLGCYNNDGKTPGHLSAWCKVHLGWAEPVIIKGSPETYSIPTVTQSTDSIYKIEVKGFGGKEYFLIENRQQKGFDEFLPSNGLLIWHVDESRATEYFPNNDYKRLFIALEQADGKNELAKRVINFNSLGPNITKVDITGDEGDVYPGDTDNRTFNHRSRPNSNSFGGHRTSINVSEISDSGDEITAKIGYTSTLTVSSELFPTSLLEVLNSNDRSR